jgi:RNA polymerase-binding protein DksA
MLTKEDIEKFKDRLLKEKLQILSDVLGEELALKYFFSQVEGDIADRAQDLYENQVLASLSGLQRQTIDKINEALRKIEEGTYGKCASCGADIEIERLEAIPYAILCSACSKKEEKIKPVKGL